MKLLRPSWLALVAISASISLRTAQCADLTASYNWKPLKIGGGGWMVGLHASPTEKGLIYARADVSGAYRWEASTSSWKQVVTETSMPKGSLTYGNYGGVDSIVSSPKEPNIAYMAFAGRPYGETDGEIYKSTDRGESWTDTNFWINKVKMEPNGIGRQEGERLAVDPNNSDVVYFGSMSNGLWTTQDAGVHWAKVKAVPVGSPLHGVNSVIFDKAGGVTDAKTNVVYVTVEEAGIYKTTDAGKTWQNIADSGPKNAGKPRESALGTDRTYYVGYDSEGAAAGSVWKYSPDGIWTNITPKNATEGGNQPYWGLAVDPHDPKHIVAMRSGGKAFVSNDQGATWILHTFKLKSRVIQWQGKQANYHLSVGEIEFDQFETGKLWFAEGFGIWYATDLTTPEIVWTSASEGIEEACGNDVIAPPGGKPVTASWDLGAFYHGEPDAYTAIRSQPGFMSCWALDWCPADPKFIVGVFRSHLDFMPQPNITGYSTDGGRTWTSFPAVADKKVPKELEYGTIAVSANSTDKIVWAPAHSKLPYYTIDRGVTWTRSSLGDVTETGFGDYPQPQKPLCADRVRPDTFYLLNTKAGVAVFRSEDAGANFVKVGSPFAKGGGKGIMKTVPGKVGHLWLAEGYDKGVFRSTDGGTTWTGVPGIKVAMNIGIGKAQTTNGYPTIFVAGEFDGKNGVFRSSDEGQTWDQIGGFPIGIPDWIDAIDGDKDVFGKAYVGFSGSGYAYGEPATAEAKP